MTTTSRMATTAATARASVYRSIPKNPEFEPVSVEVDDVTSTWYVELTDPNPGIKSVATMLAPPLEFERNLVVALPFVSVKTVKGFTVPILEDQVTVAPARGVPWTVALNATITSWWT